MPSLAAIGKAGFVGLTLAASGKSADARKLDVMKELTPVGTQADPASHLRHLAQDTLQHGQPQRALQQYYGYGSYGAGYDCARESEPHCDHFIERLGETYSQACPGWRCEPSESAYPSCDLPVRSWTGYSTSYARANPFLNCLSPDGRLWRGAAYILAFGGYGKK